jgi:hypothetical protein
MVVFLLVILAAVVLGIIGAVAKGLFYLLLIGWRPRGLDWGYARPVWAVSPDLGDASHTCGMSQEARHGEITWVGEPIRVGGYPTRSPAPCRPFFTFRAA